MALRGTLTHWKTRMLAQALGIMPCHALGILEALWHTTAELAPSGNIGRLPNQAIAMEMFYEGDAESLILALIASRHLEEHPTHRLIVHDWLQHSDHNTKRKVERRGGSMISNDGSSQVMTRHKSIPVPVPEPVPEPGAVPVEKLSPFVPTITDQANAATMKVMNEAPLSGMKVRMAIEQTARHEIASGREPEQVADAMLAAWRAFSAAKGKLEYVWGAEKFFGEGNWKDETAWPWKPGCEPKPAKHSIPDVVAQIRARDARALAEASNGS